MGVNTTGSGQAIGSTPNGFIGAPAQQTQSPFGTVSGPQPRYTGGGGVTSYGLFSSPSGPAPQQGGPPPGSVPMPTSSPYYRPPPAPPARSYNQPPAAPASGMQPGMHPSLSFNPPPLPTSLAGAMRPNPGQPPPRGMAPPASPLPLQPKQVATAPSMVAPMQQATGHQTAASYDPSQPISPTNYQDPAQALYQLLTGNAGPWMNDVGQTAPSAAGGVGSGLGGAAGQVLGQTFSGFNDAWNQATGAGGAGPSYAGSMAGNMPGFQDSSLTGAVAQNAMSMMDPRAWEQMAANRQASADQSNLAGLNLAQRRMADSQGRTGLANNGGILGNLYANYARNGIQSQRDIYNDTLGNQMNAMGVAGNLAQGMRGQDLQRWSQLAGLGGQAGMADVNAYRQDHPSGASLIGDLMGAAGGAAGQASQGGMGLMALLGPLLMGA